MPNDEERREAARVLREMCEKAAPGRREWHTYTCYVEVNNYIARHRMRGFPRSVVDLIDPGPKVDRDALLALADEIEGYADGDGMRFGRVVDRDRAKWYAHRIREALGVVE